MSELKSFLAGGTATQPRRLVVGEGETIDQAQASGRWLSSDKVVNVEQ